MEYAHLHKPTQDPIAMVANIAGIASFVLAVAGNNLDKLSMLQKFGLAIASTVMVWTFVAGLLWRYVSRQAAAFRQGAAAGTLFFGGWIGAGLLLAAIPLFGFGLPQNYVDTISLIGAGLFGLICTIGAAFGGYAAIK